MEWFRFYDEVLDDPKVQRLTPTMFKHWVNLMCLSSRQSERGTLPDINAIAFGLRLSTSKTATVIQELADSRLIDVDGETLHIHGWDRRQKRSDNVADRVAKHREKQSGHVTSNVTETLPHVRATETETETDIPPISPKGGIRPSRSKANLEGFEEWYALYPLHKDVGAAERAWMKLTPDQRVAAMEGLQRQLSWPEMQRGYEYLKHPSSWLNQKCWDDEPKAAKRSTFENAGGQRQWVG